MRYENVPENLRQYITLPEEVFNEANEVMQQALLSIAQNAYDAHQRAEQERARFEESQQRLDAYVRRSTTTDPEYNTEWDNYYLRSDSVLRGGIRLIDLTLRPEITFDRIPVRQEFVQIVIETLRRLREEGLEPANVQLGYIAEENRVRYLSFSRKDLEENTLEELVRVMNLPKEELEEELFAGSDEPSWVVTHYKLFPSTFAVFCRKIEGGCDGLLTDVSYDYYKCLDLESDDNSCLIECVRYFSTLKRPPPFGDGLTAAQVRRFLNIPPGMVGLKYISSLESFFGTDVSVYDDAMDVEFKHIDGDKWHQCRAQMTSQKQRIVYGDLDCPNKIVFKKDHFAVIVGEHDPELCHCKYTGLFVGRENDLEKDKVVQELIATGRIHSYDENDEPDDNTLYYCFDFETCYKWKSLIMKPYGWSLTKADHTGKIIDKKCFLSDPDDPNVGKTLIDELREESRRHRKNKKYLIGYNNSRFDNFILLSEAIKYRCFISNTFMAGNTILGMNVEGFICFDLCRFLNMSLEKACKGFQCELVKDKLDHDEVQSAYYNGTFKEYMKGKEEHVKFYVTRDSEATSELFFKAKRAFAQILDIPMESAPTLASLVYRNFKKFDARPNGPGKHTLPVLDKELDDFVRRSVVGGRAQVFEKGHIRSKLCSIDCVSLYPYVMMNRKYPVGQPQRTKVYVKNKIGVYNVTILRQPKVKIVPYRPVVRPLDWNYEEAFECVLTSVDIECLLRHKASVMIKDGIYWENDTEDLFHSFFMPIMVEKMKQDAYRDAEDTRYNKAMRECVKLILNGLSGKLIQRVFEDLCVLIYNKETLERFQKSTHSQQYFRMGGTDILLARGKKNSVRPTMPSIIGTLIYAYSRTHMYDSILSKGFSVYAMDTDSAMMKVSDFIIFSDEEKDMFGNEFGQFKEEITELVNETENEKGPFAYFVAPKCYCFYKIHPDKRKEIIKLRFKGIKTSSDEKNNSKEITDEHIVQKLVDGQMSDQEMHELYYNDYVKHGVGSNSNQVGNEVSLETFERLTKGQIIHVLCSNIEKAVARSDHALILRSRFIIKKIDLSGNVQKKLL
jgi:hypothetical protein